MRGYGTSVAPVHAGIRQDLEMLLNAFKEKQSLRFKDFAAIFKELDMGLIFAGRQCAAELIEFEEHLLKMSAVYMMTTRFGENAGYPLPDPVLGITPEDGAFGRKQAVPRSLPPPILPMPTEGEIAGNELMMVERVFGVYACYSFFYLQPTDYVAQIRITPSQMREVLDFAKERLLPDRHLDVLGCLYKLVNDGAFRIVAFENCYDPASHKRYETGEEADEAVPEDSEPPLGNLKTITDDSSLKQFDYLARKYEEAKAKMGISRTVNMGNLDVGANAKKIYTDANISLSTNALDDDDEGGSLKKKTSEKDERSRLSIKQAAYAAEAKSNRNRRYAFANHKEEMEGNEDDTADETYVPTEQFPPKKRGRLEKKHRIRDARKNREETMIREMAEDMNVMGIPVLVRSPSKRGHTTDDDHELMPDLNESGGRKLRGRKPNAPKLKASDAALLTLTKSKAVAKADRELEKLMKMCEKK